MRPIRSLPPMMTPFQSVEDLYNNVKDIRDAVAELQTVVTGQLVIGEVADDPDSIGNLASAIIDVVWPLGGSSTRTANNPLGRIINGAVLLMSAGSSIPAYYANGAVTGLDVINGETEVAYTSISTVYLGGLFIASGGTVPETVYNIIAIDSGKGFTITPAYTGATATIDGQLVSSLSGNTLYFYATDTTDGIWSRWLIF